MNQKPNTNEPGTSNDNNGNNNNGNNDNGNNDNGNNDNNDDNSDNSDESPNGRCRGKGMSALAYMIRHPTSFDEDIDRATLVAAHKLMRFDRTLLGLGPEDFVMSAAVRFLLKDTRIKSSFRRLLIRSVVRDIVKARRKAARYESLPVE